MAVLTNIRLGWKCLPGTKTLAYYEHFILLTPVLFRHLWQLQTVAFLHWCLKHAVLLTDVTITLLDK
jgi:hypothetical protein